MEGRKSNREIELRERHSLIFSRILVLRAFVNSSGKPHSNIYPDHVFVARLPQTRAVLDVPTDVQITAASLEEGLKPHMDEIVSTWKTRTTATLVEKINTSTTVQFPLDTDLSRLALSMFFLPSERETESRFLAPGDPVRAGQLRTYPAILLDPTCQLNPCGSTDKASSDEFTRRLDAVLWLRVRRMGVPCRSARH